MPESWTNFPTVGGKEMRSQSAVKWGISVMKTTRWLALLSVSVLQRESGVTLLQLVKVLNFITNSNNMVFVVKWSIIWHPYVVQTIPTVATVSKDSDMTF